RAIVPRGVNFIVDSAGAEALIGAALAGLAVRGTLGLVAVPPAPDRKLEMPWANTLLQGQIVQGFMEGSSIPDIFIPRMIDLYAQGRFPFDKLIRFYPFDATHPAAHVQPVGRAIKPLLDVSVA